MCIYAIGKEREIPDWQRTTEKLTWCGSDKILMSFGLLQSVFERLGRGAIVVDTNTVVRQSDHAGNPMYYSTAEQIEENAWEAAIKMVHEYNS